MSLRRVECEGYKAFGSPTAVTLTRLNVIFGRNNSGKTTLARLPIFAAASFVDLDRSYALSAGNVRFGSSFLELASPDQAHPRIAIGLEWDRAPLPSGDASEAVSPGIGLKVVLQHVSKGVEQQTVQLTRLTIDDGLPVEFRLGKPGEDRGIQSALDALEPSLKAGVERRRADLRRLVQDLLHIPGGRPRIEDTYSTRDATAWTVGEVPYLLASDRRLMDEVARWFADHLDGVRIDVDQAAFAFRFVEERRNFSVGLSQSGRGIQSVLPVAALLLAVASRRRQTQLVVVEEPEEHLHPSAHGAVADLLIGCSAEAQTIVETHSEHLLLRLRRRIAEGYVAPSDVAFYYLDDRQVVEEIHIDEMGAASNWPTGVFESDIDEAQAIVEAKLSAMEHLGTRSC